MRESICITLNANGIITYRIDPDFRLMAVGGEWDEFAGANSGEGVAGDKTLGHSLWDFIDGDTVRELYQKIIEKVRSGKEIDSLVFRCDSPEIRRILEMVIKLEEDGNVLFSVRILSEKKRPAVALLDVELDRSSEILHSCSWCNRFKVSEDRWEEAEIAVNELRLFEKTMLPTLSHGLCNHCFKKVFVDDEETSGGSGCMESTGTDCS